MGIVDGADAPMTAVGFVRKWAANTQSERRIAQAHFTDLCRLLHHPTPSEDDPGGERFSFEKPATKIGERRGFADVWKANHFTWEL